MKVDDFTFEHRPVSELPDSDLAQWLADFNGDDQWSVEGDTTEAAVVLGDHIIIWKDESVTDEDKEEAVAEYESTLCYRGADNDGGDDE